MRWSLRLRAILHRELGQLDLWRSRAVVLAYAVLTGLSIVWFARTTEWALAQFFSLRQAAWWSPLVWTPLSTAAIVWITRRWVPGAAGSGIPQVMAALDPQVERSQRGLYVSLKLALGKNLLAAAYGDDKVDLAVGPTASPVALAMLPVAEEYKKILLVEPAVADSITGDKWNKYIFRTGRNSSQDAIANAVAVDKVFAQIDGRGVQPTCG